MRLLVMLMIFFLLTACNNQTPAENESRQSNSDSLLSEVLASHDVAMPKMIKLERLKKQAQAEVDSLRKKGANNERVIQLNALVNTLATADMAMQDWMTGFKYDSLKNDEQQREAYLKMQLVSVNKMRDLVVSGIEKADSVLVSR